MAQNNTAKNVAPHLQEAVIIGGNRIPFAKAHTKYAEASNQDMLTAALEGLIARFGLAGEVIGEVAAGAVLKHSKAFNLTRESVLGSSLDPRTPAYDVQQACATGLEAIVGLHNKITLGQIESGIGGGVDSISDAPIAVNEGLRKWLLDLSRARTLGERVKLVGKVRPGFLSPDAPDVGEPRTGLSMGEHMAITTAKWGITREAQDDIAYRSHVNLAAAYDAGFFDDLMTSYLGVTRDTILRPDTSMDKLAKLSPVFGKRLETPATMTAGNSTAMTDGASSVLMGSREWAASRNLPMLARIVDAQAAGVDFVHGTEGLLMGPAYAAPRLLARNGLSLDDLDYIEIHEAFASTVLATMAAWESEEFGRTKLGLDGAFGTVDREKLNVNGSSLATGHPFAATGGRIVASLAKMLSQRSVETGKPARGLVSICAAGGIGYVALMEGIVE